MKKVFFFLVAVSLGLTVSAQTAPAQNPQKAADMKDLRKDIREKRKDKKELRKDVLTGNTAGAAAEKAEIKAENKDIKQDAQKLKGEGVKHPIRRAERQVRKHG